MILDFKRFCAYVCPICMEASINELNIFDFSGSKTVRLGCMSDECRENCLNISSYNNKYRLEQYCPVCGENHTYNINKNIFWTRPIINLKCYVSGMDILYIGEYEKVEASIHEQQQVFDDARSHHEELNLVLEIIECINSFAEEQRMYCECGCRDIRATVSQNDITLSCPECGNKKVLGINIETLSALLNLDSIVLNNI